MVCYFLLQLISSTVLYQPSCCHHNCGHCCCKQDLIFCKCLVTTDYTAGDPVHPRLLAESQIQTSGTPTFLNLFGIASIYALLLVVSHIYCLQMQVSTVTQSYSHRHLQTNQMKHLYNYLQTMTPLPALIYKPKTINLIPT